MIDRRDFLQGTFNVLMAGYVGFDKYYDLLEKKLEHQLKTDKEQLEHMIYHDLPAHVHKINIHAVRKVNGVESELNREAYGVIRNGELLTCYHNTDISVQKIRTPFGVVMLFPEILKKEVRVNDYLLESIVGDKDNDTIRYKVPKYACLPDFPNELNHNPKLGEEVYIIGNPNNSGVNIRKAHVSDLDGTEQFPMTKNSFGIDNSVIPGDSGTPCVDSKGQLLGLNSYKFFELGYVKRINEYLKQPKVIK